MKYKKSNTGKEYLIGFLDGMKYFQKKKFPKKDEQTIREHLCRGINGDYNYLEHEGKKYALLLARKSKNLYKTLPCPFCGIRHAHSYAEGFRAAHCSSDSYIFDEIVCTDGTVLYQSDGYYLMDVKTFLSLENKARLKMKPQGA